MQQYTGRNNLNGFMMSGDLYPGKIAEEIYGDKFDYGHACAYLLRRFGFHLDGYDDYKELASWTLTTPMDGVYLWVSIRGHSHTSCCFGVEFSKEVYKKLRWLECMERLVRIADAQRLAMENGYPFATYLKRKWNRRDRQAVRTWEKQQGILQKKWEDFSKEEQDKFWNELTTEMDNRLSHAWDDLDKCGWINPVTPRLEKFTSEINEALRHALTELLKPVHVRDCYINILGQVKDKDLPCSNCKHGEDGDCPDDCDKHAQPHKYAGFGVEKFVEAFQKDESQKLKEENTEQDNNLFCQRNKPK